MRQTHGIFIQKNAFYYIKTIYKWNHFKGNYIYWNVKCNKQKCNSMLGLIGCIQSGKDNEAVKNPGSIHKFIQVKFIIVMKPKLELL